MSFSPIAVGINAASITGTSGGAVGYDSTANWNMTGTNVTIVGSPGTNTLTFAAPSGVFWAASIAGGAINSNVGYLVTVGANSYSLPATSLVGEMIGFNLSGGTSWTITQGAGQVIHFGNVDTTSGVGGSLASNAAGDTVLLVCSVADLEWNVISSIGNPTVV